MTRGACLASLSVLWLLWGCSPASPPEKPPALPAVEHIQAAELPLFQDDLDIESLRTAAAQSLAFFNRVPEDRTFPLGEIEVPASRIRETIRLFLHLLDTRQLSPANIADSFDVYRMSTGHAAARPLVTGYFEPVLEASLKPDAEFCHPLYGIPPDLVTIDLSAFDPEKYAGVRLTGRLKDKQVVPYFNRREIDGEHALEDCRCRIAWLKDPVDLFFLHVQGSGMLRLPGGGIQRVGYAGANGRPYRSIGKVLVDRGLLAMEEVSLQTIRRTLREHPGICEEVLWSNESYVFFRPVDIGPLGSLNVPVTAGRSIATDPRYHPRGALAFLVTQKPRIDDNGEVSGWEPLQRWVLNQDTGGAIKGVGRVDLFCGTGSEAEAVAGRLYAPFNTLKKDHIGIGLALAEKVAKAHGGKLTVANKKDTGLLVELALPLSDAHGQPR